MPIQPIISVLVLIELDIQLYTVLAITVCVLMLGPCLYESGLVPEKLTYKDDAQCLDYGIGLTNMVARTTRGSSDLSK